jgi:hypothetical protein
VATAVPRPTPVAGGDVHAVSPVAATSFRPGPGPVAPAPNLVGLAAGKPRPPAPRSSATPAASAAKPAVDCNPSYYYDADGNKHFKPECFGR